MATLLFVVFTANSYAQQQANAKSGTPFQIFDSQGNQYSLKDISRPLQHRNPGECPSGDYFCEGEYFNTVFDFPINSNSVEEYGSHLCQLALDFSELIMARQPDLADCSPCEKPTLFLRVEISWTTSEIASISPLFVNYGNGNFGEKIHSVVWHCLNSGKDQLDNPVTQWGPGTSSLAFGNFYHGFIHISNAFEFHMDLNTDPAAGISDFYTVMLHEFYHLFGMTSNISDPLGSSVLGGSPTAPQSKYTDFDTHIHYLDGSGVYQPVLIEEQSFGCSDVSNSYTYDFMASAIVGSASASCGELVYISDHFPEILPLSNGTQQIYNEISHFDPSCWASTGLPESFLGPTAIVDRSIEVFEAKLLCDWGYQISGRFGSSQNVIGTNYSNEHHFDNPADYACGELRVVAADDPCQNAFVVDDCIGITITAEELMANDENVEFIYAESVLLESNIGGTLSLQADANGHLESLYFAIDNSSGYYLLSYVGGANLMSGCLDSNRATVVIYSEYCYGLNCSNSDDCNLICNPGLDFDVIGSSFRYFDCFRNSDVDTYGWGGNVRTPDYHPEWESFPEDPNNLLAYGTSENPCILESAVYLSYNEEMWTVLSEPLQNDKRYLLSLELMAAQQFSTTLPAGSIVDLAIDFRFTDGNLLVEECNTWPNCRDEVIDQSAGTERLELSIPVNECFKTAICIEPGDWPLSDDINGLYIDGDADFFSPTIGRVDLLEDKLYGLQDQSYICSGEKLEIGPTLDCNDYFEYYWHVSYDGGLTFDPSPVSTASPLVVESTEDLIVYRLSQELVGDGQWYNADPCVEEEAVYYSVQNDPAVCCLEATEYMISEKFAVTTASDLTSFGPTVITVNADLVITNDLSVSNLQFRFGPKGRVIVKPGVKANFRACSFKGTKCETMWPGMIAMGEGPGSKSPAVLRLEDCLVQDAIVGLATCHFEIDDFNTLSAMAAATTEADFEEQLLPQLFSNSAIQTSGGYVDTYSNNHFENCLIAVSATHGNSFASVYGTTIEQTGELNYPLSDCQHTAGVFSKDIRSMRITRSSFLNQSFGVQANTTTELSVFDCNFFQHHFGVWTLNSGNPNGRIQRCEFEACPTAISAERDRLTITDNKINEETQQGTTLGMRIKDCYKGTRISSNYIGNTKVGIQLISNNWPGDLYINRNHFFQNSLSIYSQGINSMPLITCNEMEGYDIAIYIDAYNAMGISELGMLRQQGSCALGSAASNTYFPSGSGSFEVYNNVFAGTLNHNHWDNGLTNVSIGVNSGCSNTLTNINCGPIGPSWKGNAETEMQNESVSVSVYPVPAKSILHFDMQSQESAVLKVYSALGQLMGTWNIQEQLNINVQEWPSGFYLYEIADEQGLIQQDKLLITE